MLQQFRTLALPLAMLCGFLFSRFFAMLNFMTPYLIFAMLFITFCRLSFSQIKVTKFILLLLFIQIFGGVVVFFALRAIDLTYAEGLMICVFAPTAVSSVVVGGLLGANVATMATFALVSNISAALLAPIMFSVMGVYEDMSFLSSSLIILSKIAPLLLVPIVSSFLIEKIAPRFHRLVKERQIVSFYLWAFALMIVTGRTVQFISSQSSEHYLFETVLGASAFLLCVLQFLCGRIVGKRFGDTIAGGQSIGQKNTILAIWMSQMYLSPLASIAPASYVLWQNIVNSYQLWRHRERVGSGK